MKLRSFALAANFGFITFSMTTIGPVHAAEVNLLSAEVMRHAINEVSAEFERTTGHKLTVKYDSAAVVKNGLKATKALTLQSCRSL